MRKRVVQINTQLHKVTGIQHVMLDIHEALKDDFETRIAGTLPYEKVNPDLGINRKEYFRLINPLSLRNSVVIIHERRLLPLMRILEMIPGLGIKCVYVHHSEMHVNRTLSFFPKNIVAISDAGIKNLTDYFKVSPDKITKIHNCVRELEPYVPPVKPGSGEITILYPARINSGKQQIEIIRHLRGKLDKRVRILFAGTGPQHSELSELCKNDSQFVALGFRNDIEKLMRKTDYVMLFSQFEGLPISLIEAGKNGIPAICNHVGGICEIVEDGVNGFVANDWDSMLVLLNSLPSVTPEQWRKMGDEGRRLYEERFTFERFKQQYINLVEKISNA
ncbi:MAG: glycosyltransferase [Muribaculaceae bacterium]|nr:glycosyltransferase [Muribaculaceae bacterium]